MQHIFLRFSYRFLVLPCLLLAFASSSVWSATWSVSEHSSVSSELELTTVHWRKKAHKHKKRLKRKRKKRRAKKAAATKPGWWKKGPNKNPVQVLISLPKQQMTVYEGSKIVATSRISSGKPGHVSPAGVFSILHKNRHHRSNIYSNAPMPFMQRLTWSGIALHQGRVPNRPASHGCIRMPGDFASQLFSYTKSGMHVIVANEDVAPTQISHRNLFNSASMEEAAKILDRPGSISRGDGSPFRILLTRWTGWHRTDRVQMLLAGLGYYRDDIDGMMGPNTRKAIEDFRAARNMPSSQSIDRSLLRELYKASNLPAPLNGRLYVRQNFKHVFDVPIAIALDGEGKDTPLGTHMMQAMHFEFGEPNVRWRGVTLTKGTGPTARKVKRKTTAQQDLDRIIIPSDIRKAIEAILTPGSSVSIANNGLSRETMPKGSDFVLLMQ